jgi:hypothetical protein
VLGRGAERGLQPIATGTGHGVRGNGGDSLVVMGIPDDGVPVALLENVDVV